MKNNIDKIHIIDKSNLNSEFYFQSLLEEAHGKGLLSDSDIERLQYECIDLLSRKVESYNLGDSSIKIENAQNIMTSNLYTIGLWLKTYSNPDEAVVALQSESINEIYKKGRNEIDIMVASTKEIHEKLINELLDTENVFYSSTINDGIEGFFKLYYPDFSAHEIHITADYPIYNHISKLNGIEFIKAYLNALYYENLFCLYFSKEDIHHLLCGHKENYQELLINIYEYVLTIAIGCIIAGLDPYKLDISDSGAIYLYQLFSNISNDEVYTIIKKAFNELEQIFKIQHGLKQYIENSLPLIADNIRTASQKNMLEKVFFVPAYPENNPKIFFSKGEKMDNEKYRDIIEEIRECRFTQDKLEIIKENIHSFADLEDVLLDADFLKEEMLLILRQLSLPELASLYKNYPLESEIEAFELREQEQYLRECLHYFISTLPQNQQEMIEKANKALE